MAIRSYSELELDIHDVNFTPSNDFDVFTDLGFQFGTIRDYMSYFLDNDEEGKIILRSGKPKHDVRFSREALSQGFDFLPGIIDLSCPSDPDILNLEYITPHIDTDLPEIELALTMFATCVAPTLALNNKELVGIQLRACDDFFIANEEQIWTLVGSTTIAERSGRFYAQIELETEYYPTTFIFELLLTCTYKPYQNVLNNGDEAIWTGFFYHFRRHEYDILTFCTKLHLPLPLVDEGYETEEQEEWDFNEGGLNVKDPKYCNCLSFQNMAHQLAIHIHDVRIFPWPEECEFCNKDTALAIQKLSRKQYCRNRIFDRRTHQRITRNALSSVTLEGAKQHAWNTINISAETQAVVTNFTDAMNRMTDIFSNTTQPISLQSASEAFIHPIQTAMEQLILTASAAVAAFFVGAFIIWIAYKFPKIACSLIALISGTICWRFRASLDMSIFFDWFREKLQTQVQAYDEVDGEQIDNFIRITDAVQNSYAEYSSLIMTSLFGLLSLVVLKHLPNDKETQSFEKKCANVPRAIRGVVDMIKIFGTTHEWLDNFVRTKILKQENALAIDGGASEVQLLVNEVQELTKKENFDRIKTNAEMARRAMRAYYQYLEMAKNKHLFTPEVRNTMLTIGRACYKIWQEGLSSIALSAGARPKPPALVLCGGTHKGKTSMVNFIMIDCLRELGVTAEEIEKNGIDSYMYTRNVEQEFWDGYKDQPGVLYDDAFSKKDCVAAPNPEFAEIIHGVNSFSFPLHMASIEEKSNTRLQAKYFVFTTNALKIDCTSLTNPEAISSRLSHVYHVDVNPEYAIIGADGLSRIDEEKATANTRAPVNLNAYRMKRMTIDNQGNFQTTGEPLTYLDMMTEFRRAIRKSLEKHEVVSDCLKEYARTPMEAFSETFATGTQPPRRQILTVDDGTIQIHQAMQNGWREWFRREPKPSVRVTRIHEEDGFDATFYDAQENPISWNWMLLTTTIEEYHERIKEIGASLKERLDRLETYAREHPWKTSLAAILMGIGAVVTGYAIYKALTWKMITLPKNAIVAASLPSVHSEAFGVLAPTCKNLVEYTSYKNIEGCYKTNFGEPEQYGDNNLVTFDDMTKANSFSEKKQRLERTRVHSFAPQKQKLERARVHACSCDVKVEVVTENLPNFLSRVVRTKYQDFVKIFVGDKRYSVSTEDINTDEICHLVDGNEHISIKDSVQHGAECDRLSIKAQKNTMLFCSHSKELDKTQIMGYVLFVQGTLAIMPLHFKNTVQAFSPEITYSLRSLRTEEFLPISREQVLSGHILHDHQDAYMFDAGLSFAQRPKITQSFIDEHELDKVKHVRARVVSRVMEVNCTNDETFVMRDGHVTLRTVEGPNSLSNSDNPLLPEGVAPEPTYYRDIIVADNIPSLPSECGAPLILDNNFIRGKICGQLTLGFSNGISTGFSIITKQDLEKCILKFDKQARIHLGTAKTVNDVVTASHFNGNMLAEGTTKPYPQAFKTSLRKNDYYEKILPCEVAPARLFRTYGQDDPMYLGLANYAETPPLIDLELLEAAAMDVQMMLFTTHRTNYPPELFRNNLSFEEAIEGVYGLEFMDAINRGTSPGHPWQQDKPAHVKGKQWYFGSDSFDYTTPQAQKVRQVCEEMEEDAKNLERYEAIFVATLKDELRPPHKVDIPRVFSAGPMHFTITARKWLLGFIAYVQTNRIDNGIAVGTNPFEGDWDHLTRHLKKFPNVIDGDFKKFDSSIPAQILIRATKIMVDFYCDQTEEEENIRMTLCSMITKALHLVDGVVYQWNHSLPSGNPFTATLNSVVNLIIMRMSWLSETKMPLSLFNEHVRMIAYGDDNILSVSNTMIDRFNFFTMKEGLAKIGMTYTDASKTGVERKCKTLEEVQFIKRGFRFREDLQRWVAPLDLSSISKMLNYHHKCAQPEQAQADNITCAFRELSLHDETIFKDLTIKIYQNVPTEILRLIKVEPTYAEYSRLWRIGKIDVTGAWLCGGTQIVPGVIQIQEARQHVGGLTQQTPGLFRKVPGCSSPANNDTVSRAQGFGRPTPRNHPRPATTTTNSNGNMESTTSIADSNAPTPIAVTDPLEPVAPKLTTQDGMSDRQITQETEGGTVTLNADAQETLVFTDMTKKMLSSAVREPKNPPNIKMIEDTSCLDYTKQGIENFLQTALELGNFTWTTSTPAINAHVLPSNPTPIIGETGTPYLFSASLPEDMISKHFGFWSKVMHFAMLRGDFVIRVIINKQPFQQGGLLAFGLPYPNRMQTSVEGRLRGTLTSLTSIPSKTWNINESQVLEFRMPAVGPELFYDLIHNNFVWWNFYIACLVPLADPQGTGKIEGTVYAYMDNIDLRMRTGAYPALRPAAPTYKTSQLPQINKMSLSGARQHSGTEPQKQQSTGSVSGVTKSLAEAARMFDVIPGAAQYAEPVADALNAVGGIASMFGYSKPTSNATATKSTLFQGPSFLSTNGEFLGHSLASIERNALDPVKNFGGSGEEELTVLSMARRPAVLNTFDWSDTDSPGRNLINLDVSPVQAWWDSAERKFFSAPPFMMAMLPFPMYNCNWEYSFEAFDTQFQSGKLEIIYVPRYYANSINPADVDPAICTKWIWDVKQTSKYRIEVPFVNGKQWLDNPSLRNIYNDRWTFVDTSSGTIYVRVLNTLTTSGSASPKITILVTQMPTENLTVGGGLHPPSCGPYIVKPSPAKLTLAGAEQYSGKRFNQPQATGKIIKGADGSMMIKMIRDSAKETLNHTENMTSTTNCATTTGEVIVSLNPLFRRFYKVGTLGFGGKDKNLAHIRMDPGIYHATAPKTNTLTDWINVYGSMFAFRRGGMRCALKPYHPQTYATWDWLTVIVRNNIFDDVDLDETQPVGAFFSHVADIASTVSDAGELPLYTRNEGLAQLSIPYYSKYHCLLNEWFTGVDVNLARDVVNGKLPQNDAFVTPYEVDQVDETNAKVMVNAYRAAADDFSLALYLGCPIMALQVELA